MKLRVEEDPARDAVIGELKTMGYAAESIPRSTGVGGRTADIRAKYAEEPDLVIEVKTREESDSFLQELKSAPRGAPVWKQNQAIGVSNTVGREISDAMKQTRGSAHPERDLRGVWLYVTDAGMADSEKDIFEATLYGKMLAWCGDAKLRYAYFADYSRFVRYADLDFAVAQERIEEYGFSEDGRLVRIGIRTFDVMYVNPFGRRCAEVRGSRLYRQMADKGAAAEDPAEIEGRGDAFIVEPGAINKPGDTTAILTYLRDKYPSFEIFGLQNLTGFSAQARVDLEEAP